MNQEYDVIIVGAGPGGLSVAAALLKQGVSNILVVDRGSIGQSWLDYPPETKLLSETNPTSDENMIADMSVNAVCENIPHPTHLMYQYYLQCVCDSLHIPFSKKVEVTAVSTDEKTNDFLLSTNKGTLKTKRLVWATGIYSSPNQLPGSEHCYIHYAKIQNWNHIKEKEVTVVGSANGACEVVMQLAQPGRKIHLVCSHTFDVPLPIDCLWKENRLFVKDLMNQGLVDITENFRVTSIVRDNSGYMLSDETGKSIHATTKPILCIGFAPNIAIIKKLISTHEEGHETVIDLDQAHQSTITPGLYLAGALGKKNADEGFIRFFRNFGPVIAKDIAATL